MNVSTTIWQKLTMVEGIAKKWVRIVRMWPQKWLKWILTRRHQITYEIRECEFCWINQHMMLKNITVKVQWRAMETKYSPVDNTCLLKISLLWKGWAWGRHSQRSLTPLEHDLRWSGVTLVTQSQQSGSKVTRSQLQISEWHEANSKPAESGPGYEYLEFKQGAIL